MAATATTNEEKIKLYDSWTHEERSEERSQEVVRALAWLQTPTATYSDALAILDQVPPVRPGLTTTATKSVSKKEAGRRPLRKVTSAPDWLDEAITRHSAGFTAVVPPTPKLSIYPHLTIDHRTPTQAETSESVTDNFHLTYILQPATRLVAAMRGEPNLSAGFAPLQHSTKGDLMVFTPLGVEDEDRTAWVTIEDKRMAVFTAHRDAFTGYASESVFRWPPSQEEMKKAPAGRRMWIQMWGQMEEYEVDFGKIFSPSGVTYIRREPGSDELSFSRVYTSMNQEVTRTACLILEARDKTERPRSQAGFAEKVTRQLPRKLWDILATWVINWTLRASLMWKYLWGADGVYVVFARRPAFFRAVQDAILPCSTTGSQRVPPLLFTRLIGYGACGTVWRSADGSAVIKIFEDCEPAFHEAAVLATAHTLSIPKLWGVVSDKEEFGLVMSYTGTPIRNLKQAPVQQRQQLVRTLASLHDLGIHHHDVRADNVLVDEKGVLTLIDFDRAEFIDGPCIECPDAEIMKLLCDSSDGWAN
ncbi:hypothetical protein B0H11DRAFT_2099439 [Mycena galericulata]|nr:hypothetical protein B0H11DRAFT_2099439 [Mycena galericulata]